MAFSAPSNNFLIFGDSLSSGYGISSEQSWPSLLAKKLVQTGARVRAFDPQGHEARGLIPEAEFVDGPYEAATGADCIVILTEWDQFRALDLDRMKSLMRTPLVVDLRNVYRPEDLRSRGFTYVSVGRA